MHTDSPERAISNNNNLRGLGAAPGFGPRNHMVQFYESDAFLCETVAEYFAAGLRNDQPSLAIATAPHREEVIKLLIARGLDVDAASHKGLFTFLDARETLSEFMQGTQPDGERFKTVIGSVLKEIGKDSNLSVRAFGEMVDLLWRDGNQEGAIRLEQFWNELSKSHRFSLLCAYPIGNFYRESHWPDFQKVCDQHGHVIPTERFNRVPEDDRLREISFLQQRARALESEIEARKDLEKSLRLALEEKQRAEAERESLLVREKSARIQAEKASRLKDDFLAVVSHELRTPLTSILGWAQIVDMRRDTSMVRRAMEVIQRNAKLQLHLIDDLLDVSRILTGKMVITPGPVDLAALLGVALDSVRPAAQAKGIELQLESAHDTPSVTGDFTRLQQVIWNLLSNAIKFTPKEGIVSVRLDQEGSSARITVQDNGQGIDPDFLPHVFDRFRQADAGTARKFGGLGLGLAVVRHLVEAHGGTVTADSRGPGLGATFIVTLPIRSSGERVLSEALRRG